MLLREEAVLKAFESLQKKSLHDKYKYDPVLWVKEVLKIDIWSKQEEILNSLVTNKKTAVKSCHAASKTHTSALAVCWWVSTRPRGVVRTTAPTSYQVSQLLWKEIRSMHADHKLVGEVNQKDEWKTNVGGAINTVGSGQKPSDTNIHSFHGVHAIDGVLTVIDEGCFSADTEVLTETGWKLWPDVTMNDRIASVDTDTGRSEFVSPTDLIKYWHDGDMYVPDNPELDFMVTPDHEMLVRDPENRWVRENAEDIAHGIFPVQGMRGVASTLSSVSYSGMVYCATMPRNHTLYTRRNGGGIWTGNCGVVESLFTAADAISTGRYDRVLTVGNPDDPNTSFGRIFLDANEKNKHIWNRITISAFDTPNFTGEEVPKVVADNLIQKDWVEARAIEWGTDSGRYKSKILGEFPEQSDNNLFSQKSIYSAHEVDIPEDENFPLILGVDIASGGEDDTVIYGNRGGRVRKVANWNEGNAVYTANRILEVAGEQQAEEIRIDSGGFGKGVIDILLKNPKAKNFRIIRMMGGDAAADPNAHRNKRAENYDNLRMMMELGEIDLDPLDTKVEEELLGVRVLYTERGSIKLEAKDDIRKRGGKSPDNVDAIVYATADLSYLFEGQEAKNEAQDPSDYLGMVPDWAMTRW